MTTTTSKLTAFPRILAVAGAFAALAATTTSFAAQPSDDPPSVTVRYADLDVTTAAGASVLYHRITVAAQQVCPVPDTRELGRLLASERCQANAIAQAVQKLNNPQLALVHAAHVSRG